MIRLALSTLLTSIAGTLLGWAVRLTARIAPLRPDPIEVPAATQEPAPERAVIIHAEDLPLRYALLLAADDMPDERMPPGMRLAYLLAGARPLTGGSRCPVN